MCSSVPASSLPQKTYNVGRSSLRACCAAQDCGPTTRPTPRRREHEQERVDRRYHPGSTRPVGRTTRRSFRETAPTGNSATDFASREKVVRPARQENGRNGTTVFLPDGAHAMGNQERPTTRLHARLPPTPSSAGPHQLARPFCRLHHHMTDGATRIRRHAYRAI